MFQVPEIFSTYKLDDETGKTATVKEDRALLRFIKRSKTRSLSKEMS